MRWMNRSPNRSMVLAMRSMSIRSLPTPTIMAARARLVHQRAHPPHRAVDAAKDRLADQEVADIQLDNRRDRGHRTDRVEAQSVTGVTFEAKLLRLGGGALQARELLGAGGAGGVAISAGMKLDHGRAQRLGGFELCRIGLDEQRD